MFFRRKRDFVEKGQELVNSNDFDETKFLFLVSEKKLKQKKC